MPNLHYEKRHGHHLGRTVCGVDEVGRGPLAGPVVAVAAIVPADGLPRRIVACIRDSKQLSEKQREDIYPELIARCVHAAAEASVAEILELNILWASLLAMQRAVSALPVRPHHALIDGNRAPTLDCPATPIVKGDDKSLSIAVASIIAKVTRDRFMKKLAAEFPHYGWEQNAGYGTPYHLDALRRHGPTCWHRDAFAPVAELKRQTA